MKKILFFAAAALMLGAAVSCEEKKPVDPTPSAKEVQTAKEALVVHLPFESSKDAVAVGAGISYETTAGDAGFDQAGFIGSAYANMADDNTAEAYLKLKLAAGNAFTKLESMTFSAWVKLPAGKEAKGGLLSFNGTAAEAVWPSFVFLFDNYNADTDEQWFNGRIDFLSVEGKPAMWPNSASTEYAKKDTWIHIARTFDVQSGHWVNYANGVKVGEGDFLVNDQPVGPIKSAFASDCNALYIGGWASRIEGKAADAWQGYFPGAIDEVRFYNMPLTEDQVNKLYKEELAISLDQ